MPRKSRDTSAICSYCLLEDIKRAAADAGQVITLFAKDGGIAVYRHARDRQIWQIPNRNPSLWVQRRLSGACYCMERP